VINFPKEICDAVFDGSLAKGTIVKTMLKCEDGKEKPHYFVVVSKNAAADPKLLVVATSKTDFYDKYPYYNRDIIRINANEFPPFELNTVVDCRRLHNYSNNKLKEYFRDGDLHFAGNLPSDKLKQIDTIVKQSAFIPLKGKKQVL